MREENAVANAETAFIRKAERMKRRARRNYRYE